MTRLPAGTRDPRSPCTAVVPCRRPGREVVRGQAQRDRLVRPAAQRRHGRVRRRDLRLDDGRRLPARALRDDERRRRSRIHGARRREARRRIRGRHRRVDRDLGRRVAPRRDRGLDAQGGRGQLALRPAAARGRRLRLRAELYGTLTRAGIRAAVRARGRRRLESSGPGDRRAGRTPDRAGTPTARGRRPRP